MAAGGASVICANRRTKCTTNRSDNSHSRFRGYMNSQHPKSAPPGSEAPAFQMDYDWLEKTSIILIGVSFKGENAPFWLWPGSPFHCTRVQLRAVMAAVPLSFQVRKPLFVDYIGGSGYFTPLPVCPMGLYFWKNFACWWMERENPFLIPLELGRELHM